MIESRSKAALFVLAVSMVCCGGGTVLDNGTGGTGGTGSNPLVGSWNGSANFGPPFLSEQVTFRSNGTATAIDTFSGEAGGPCTGALDITDSWTSTSSTFSVSDGTCTGQIACPINGTTSCGPDETAPETCTYTLSDGDDTLVLDCPEAQGPITFMRQN
jgi:hypothetical protein